MIIFCDINMDASKSILSETSALIKNAHSYIKYGDSAQITSVPRYGICIDTPIAHIRVLLTLYADMLGVHEKSQKRIANYKTIMYMCKNGLLSHYIHKYYRCTSANVAIVAGYIYPKEVGKIIASYTVPDAYDIFVTENIQINDDKLDIII